MRVILYVKDIPKVAEFYRTHFGMRPLASDEEGWLELESKSGGCNIALHRAPTAQRSGAAIKIAFGVADVRQFKKEREAAGLNSARSMSPAASICQCKRPGGQLHTNLKPGPDLETAT
jgi:catechol 2,3-dioxygenase-like lactoylglutathione lyase family enzyme